MDASFHVSLAASFARLATIRDQLHERKSYEQFSKSVSWPVDEAFTMTEPVFDSAPSSSAGVRATVREMVRVTLAFFIFIGSAVAGLWFGTEAIRLLIGGVLLVGVWPLYAILRRTAEASGIERAAHTIRAHRERA
jgi:hypothetical protein